MNRVDDDSSHRTKPSSPIESVSVVHNAFKTHQTEIDNHAFDIDIQKISSTVHRYSAPSTALFINGVDVNSLHGTKQSSPAEPVSLISELMRLRMIATVLISMSR